MIRVRDGEEECILTIEEFERRARQGEISPFSLVSIPALTGERFVEARELPLFVAIYDPRRVLFRRHFHLGRLPLVTGVIALVCVALYLIARDEGGGVATREVLLALGAKARARIVDEGEAWRLLAANLLHRDAVHLGFNLFALLNVGTVLEGVYRRGDYVLMLVVSGVSTMTLSAALSGPVTVGASGLVFGCLGCAVVFGLRFSEVLPLRYRVYFGVVVVGYAAFMFYLGLQRPTTDNWGHAGGLLAGVLMGCLLEPRLLRLRGTREPLRALVLPWAITFTIIAIVSSCGSLVTRALFRYEPYAFDAFGVVLERPSTWAKGPDPLGFLAFGNGVDALTSLACSRMQAGSKLDDAVRRFIDGELMALSRQGHIGELEVLPVEPGAIGGTERRIEARRIPFSFLGGDGPFQADAWLFSRGELECAFVLAHRGGASARSVEILEEIRARLRLVATRAEMNAADATRQRPASPRAWLELALAHQGAGDITGARTAFAQAVSVASGEHGYQSRVHFARARFELDHGEDVNAAITAARQAVAASPVDVDAALLLTDALLRAGNASEARAVLDGARTRAGVDARFDERDRLLELLERVPSAPVEPGRTAPEETELGRSEPAQAERP